jgi:hypothetical protein
METLTFLKAIAAENQKKNNNKPSIMNVKDFFYSFGITLPA